MKKYVLAMMLAMFSVSSIQIAQATTETAHHKKVVKHKVVRKKAVAPKTDPIPDGAEVWRCNDNSEFYVKGDMKRDAVLTLHWNGKNYQLPREQTTTGADRFHDGASGMDLVVIPTKAMLLNDKEGDRLADGCMTAAMTHQGESAPTQSNALRLK